MQNLYVVSYTASFATSHAVVMAADEEDAVKVACEALALKVTDIYSGLYEGWEDTVGVVRKLDFAASAFHEVACDCF